MTKTLVISLFLAFPALVQAGALSSLVSAAKTPSLPLPAVTAPVPLRAALPDAAWIAAVKKAYLYSPIGTLQPADPAELPAAALQQMQWDAQVYPSKAYKLLVDGRMAYVIENDNLDALYVNIFDAAGEHIAYGGFDENYDFYWLLKKRG